MERKFEYIKPVLDFVIIESDEVITTSDYDKYGILNIPGYDPYGTN